MLEQPAGEKTLPASPRKLQRAREEGNVAKSQDLSAAVMLLVAVLGLRFIGPAAFEEIGRAFRYYFENAHALAVEPANVTNLAGFTMLFIARSVLPFMALLLAAGIVINITQVGFIFSAQVLTPKLQRINPISGFQRLFSLRALVELVKSLLKLALVSYVVYLTLNGRVEDLLTLMHVSPREAIIETAALIFTLWWRIVLTILIIGILDFAFQRWQYLRDLRMTRQEARQELKQLEGDPQIKQRIRQIQRQIAMQRMMRDVPTADVVVTNPLTYAVALRYDETTMEAPTVVAKGARLVADRIREVALEHDVPIVERQELARTLYRSVEIGQTIPEGEFRAVAEVLAYVYRIDRRFSRRQERARHREFQPVT